VQYQYDALNRLTQVMDWNNLTTKYTYDAAGNLLGALNPNNTTAAYSYDGANRLLNIINRNATQVLSGYGYVLDKVGNRIEVESYNEGIQQYRYDKLYRLAGWTNAQRETTQWIYDGVGNRLQQVGPQGVLTYSYDAADEMLAAGTTTFTYDGNGNQLTKVSGGTTTNYSWDALNRLTGVVAGGNSTQYQYDGDGNRVQQLVGGNTYAYVNDPSGPLAVVLSETGRDGDISYLYGISMVSATASGFQYYYQVDGLGSVADLTSSTGLAQSVYSYDPWGTMISPGTDGTKNKYKFAGEASDPGSGLAYFRARYYDVSVGRFISRDRGQLSSASPHSISQYQYVLSNPVRFTDPFGLSVFQAFAGFFGLAGQSRANQTQQNFDACMANFDSCDLDQLAREQQATELLAVQNAQNAAAGSAGLIYAGGNLGLSGTAGSAYDAVGTSGDVVSAAGSPSQISGFFRIPSAGGDATGAQLCIVNPYACPSSGPGVTVGTPPGVQPKVSK